MEPQGWAGGSGRDRVVEVVRSLILGGLEAESLLPHGPWEVIICYLVPLKPRQCLALSR